MAEFGINEKIRIKFKPIIEKFLEDSANEILAEPLKESTFELELSNKGISPYQLCKILEEDFGYEQEDQEENGWEMDFWIYFKNNSSKIKDICVSGSGMYFDLYLQIKFND